MAVIGASGDRRKFGNKAVRAFRHRGYEVVPINPHQKEIEGLQTYQSVLDAPFEIDMATIYVPPDIGERVLVELARKEIAEVWLNPGADSPKVIQRARELGFQPVLGCSLVAIGESPEDY